MTSQIPLDKCEDKTVTVVTPTPREHSKSRLWAPILLKAVDETRNLVLRPVFRRVSAHIAPLFTK